MREKYVTERGIRTDFRHQMTYGDYLQLDKILTSQKTLSNHRDEMLFIIIHQVSELWLKLVIHEIKGTITALKNLNYREAFKNLSRLSNIQKQLIQSWDVLSTLTPTEYSEFRHKLGNASGFQSYQYRLVEFVLGYKTPKILDIYKHDEKLYRKLKKAYETPGLYDVVLLTLAKEGFNLHEEVLNRDYTEPYMRDDSVEAAWLTIYKNVDKYWNLYELGEKLVDVEDHFQQWRFRHMKTVERIIGMKKGTGGSSGVGYLKRVLDHYFFPELWDLRTKM